MKIVKAFGLSSALCLTVTALAGQETNQVEQLKRQLQELKNSFQKIQEQQRQQIEVLQKQIEALQKAGATNQPAAATVPPDAAAAQMTQPWSPTAPIRIGSGQNYLNLSFDGLFAVGTSTANDIDKLETGGHDPKQRGFTVENIETTFEGKVDPYFRGQAALVHQIDPRGESFVELEEAYAESLSLPANLQLRGGQFFTEFGRQNQSHPHTWDFVDQPLVMGRFLGDDGLRSAGARLSWLTPTPFYSELYLTVQNSQGPTVHSFRNENEGEPFFGRPSKQGWVKGLGDMLFVPRYAASFNLSDSQTIVAGVLGALADKCHSGGAQPSYS